MSSYRRIAVSSWRDAPTCLSIMTNMIRACISKFAFANWIPASAGMTSERQHYSKETISNKTHTARTGGGLLSGKPLSEIRAGGERSRTRVSLKRAGHRVIHTDGTVRHAPHRNPIKYQVTIIP